MRATSPYLNRPARTLAEVVDGARRLRAVAAARAGVRVETERERIMRETREDHAAWCRAGFPDMPQTARG